jgi:hypothetical protein
MVCLLIGIRYQQTANSKQQTASKRTANQPKNLPERKSQKMSAINYDLLSEIIFTNDDIFNNINIENAKVVSCLCKAANSNKDIKLSFDRAKAYEYFDKIFDVLTHYIMYKKKESYMKREELLEVHGEEYSITSQLDYIISGLKYENNNVLYGFRELIVLEFREYIYNYEKARDSFDVKFNLDYCIQYNLLINNLGFYEYFENHTYDPKHYILKPDSLYDFANA